MRTGSRPDKRENLHAVAHRLAGVVLAAWISAGCAPKVRYPDVASAQPEEAVVQLRRHDVIHPIGEHYYLVWFDPDEGRWHRQEVLSSGRRSNVYVDHASPDATFRRRLGRRARIVREYRGERADRVIAVLTGSQAYPHERYRLWPGPNSNSYPAWVLRRARVGHDFHVRAIGRSWPPGVGLSDSRTGVALHSPVVGVEIGLLDGVEVHVLDLVFGLDLSPPAIKTPFGRLGWPQPALPVPEKAR